MSFTSKKKKKKEKEKKNSQPFVNLKKKKKNTRVGGQTLVCPPIKNGFNKNHVPIKLRSAWQQA